MGRERFKDSDKNAIVLEFANTKARSVYSSLSGWHIDVDVSWS